MLPFLHYRHMLSNLQQMDGMRNFDSFLNVLLTFSFINTDLPISLVKHFQIICCRVYPCDKLPITNVFVYLTVSTVYKSRV